MDFYILLLASFIGLAEGYDLIPTKFATAKLPKLELFRLEARVGVCEGHLKKDLYVLQRQALLASVLGARGVHELRHWLDRYTLDDNKAYSIVAAYEPVQHTHKVYSTPFT
ncbi:MAG: hypothetical protein Q9226_004309 [Calogaya cf. arnoldii]